MKPTTIRLTDNEKQALLDLAAQHGPAYKGNLTALIRGIAHGSIRLANQDKILSRIEALERQQRRLTELMVETYRGGNVG